MAELLIIVVIAGVVLLYAADRARKLRARARQMAGMNERLDAAAAKVDQQQERKQARVRASAELTSVMPAIKRPPLTLPGVPGQPAEPDEEAEAAPVADAEPIRQPEPEPDAVPVAGAAAAREAAADMPEAESRPPAADAADSVAAEAAPVGTLSVPGGLTPDAPPAPKLRITSEGTLIMPAVPVPVQGPGPDREASAAPAASLAHGASSQDRADRD